MRVRSHAESTKNAANRVQSDSDKLAIFIFSKERIQIWINYPRNDDRKRSGARPPSSYITCNVIA